MNRTMRHRDRRGRGGQILIVTLVAISLLVGLVFYVYNSVDQVNQRLEMQGAADAAATAGGGWMARGMNVVALNNTGMSKMLSLVPVLDAQPLGTKMAVEEVTAWEQCLAAQIQRGVGEGGATGNLLATGLEALRSRMAAQRDILLPYNGFLNGGGFSMELTTTYAVAGAGGAPPHGSLWQAAVTMEDFARATAESAGELAQQRAVTLAKANGATAAVLAPLVPVLPARDGTFEDFRPTLKGVLRVDGNGATLEADGADGGAIPDCAYPHRLGPWARLLRWRHQLYGGFIQTGQTWMPPTEGGRTRGGSGNVNVGGRSVGGGARAGVGGGSAGHWQTTGYREPVGYTTYGYYHWAYDHIGGWAIGGGGQAPGSLADTFYCDYVRRLANIKLNYMYPSDANGGRGSAAALVDIHYPQWQFLDYNQARAAVAANPNMQVTSTMFYKVEISSSIPEGGAGWLTPGTYLANGDSPKAIWVTRGDKKMEDPNGWRIQKIADYIWKDQYQYETTYDPRLGIQKTYDPVTGEEQWHPVYAVEFWIFGGIDTGGPVQVSNPANYDPTDRLPLPLMLDTATGEYDGEDPDSGNRREHFAYLGVARRQMEAPVWSNRFHGANAVGGTVTVAQAKVFNSTSWDLWTQDWQVQLMPVTRPSPSGDATAWAGVLQRGASDPNWSPSAGMSVEVERIIQYINAIDPAMAAKFLQH
jgi:hypothetical protein